MMIVKHYNFAWRVFARTLAVLMLAAGLCSSPVFSQTGSSPSNNASQGNVLLLYSYGHGGKGISVFDEGLINTLSAGGVGINNLFSEFLDLERNKSDQQYRARMQDLLRQKYAQRHIDVLVAVQQPALNWLLNEGKEIAPDAPIISLQAPMPSQDEVGSRHLISLLTSFDMKGTLEHALELFPGTRRVLFVSGSSEADKKMAEQTARIAEPLKGTLEYEYSGDLSLDALLARTATLPPHSIIIFTQYNRDASGLVTVAYEVESRIVKAANAPVFGLYDFNLINGGIGGSVIGVKELGEKTASTVLDLFNARLQLSRPVSSAILNPVSMFNWEQVQRWGGDASRLSGHPVFVNRVPTFWEQFRFYAIGIAAFVVAQSMLIAALLVNRRRRKLAELTLRASEAHYHHVVENTPDLITRVDRDGRFTFANRSAEIVLGLAAQECIGRSAFDFVHPDDREATQNAFKEWSETQASVLSFENRQVSHSGAVRQMQWNIVADRSASGEITGFDGVARDVTKVRQVEAALKQSEGQLRSVFDAMSEGFSIQEAVCDGAGKPIDLRFIAANPAFESQTGLKNAETLGHTLRELFPQAESYWIERYGRVALTGEAANFDAVFGPLNKHYQVSAFQTEPGRVGITFMDITERQRATDSLKRSEERFRLMFDRAGDGIMIMSLSGKLVAVNQSFARMHGYTPEEMSSLNLKDLDAPESARLAPERMQRTLAGEALTFEVEHYHKDGHVFPLEVSSSLIDSEGEPVIQAFHRDITERKKAEGQIQTLAFYDPLTALPNRRLLLDRLQQALAGSVRRQRQGALLLVDLDNFKDLNDVLGHEQGDLVLQQVAKRLGACIREGDTVARQGADEFVVLLEQLDQSPLEAAMQAEIVGNKVLDALRQPYQVISSELPCTASIGITLFGAQHEDTVEPLKRAELAMYQSKAHGRNTLRFFDPKMQAVVNSRVAMEASLREAVGKDQLVLHYQPQVTDQRQITGVEALLRWLDPKRGMVSPAEFIPMAEETGLILPIGNWVLETACKQLARWAGQPGMAHLTVAVNVSARQIHQRDFVDRVLMTLERTGAKAHRLKLELTESVLVEDVEGVIAKMNALKSKGVTFSLDDFGTGYSSLSYLQRLPLDKLKIDQGFVRDILINPNDAAIARMVVALADSLGLTVIPEGVETAAQRDFLSALGCHNFQGYLFGKPLPVQELEALVNGP